MALTFTSDEVPTCNNPNKMYWAALSYAIFYYVVLYFDSVNEIVFCKNCDENVLA